MALKAADLESELVDTVCARVRERLPEDQAGPCERFVRQYYEWVPREDLAGRDPLDLYGAAVAHWNLAQHRAAEEMKANVHNPTFEQNGWSSPHTVLELVTADMPFTVDSVTMELARQGYNIDLVIHPVMRVRRDADGRLTDVLAHDAEAGEGEIAESILHAEVARETDPDALRRLREGVERILGDVAVAVADWKPMRERTHALLEEFGQQPPPVDEGELDEASQFLGWLAEGHFTFLGYREYDLVTEDGEAILRAIPESGLGILRGDPRTPETHLAPKALALAQAKHVLLLTKANSRSTVHRPAYLDYVGVRRFNADGEVTGERRFLGLYTSAAYKESPRQIPLLRGKVNSVLSRGGFPPDSHDFKALVEILESYPRDSLFQTDADQLFDTAIGILGLGERQRVRAWVRLDPLERFVECLVCIPRDRFNTDSRERVAGLLTAAFGGTHVDWTLQLSESLLARVHYIVHTPDGPPEAYDVPAIEARLAQAVRAWPDELRNALEDQLGEEGATKLLGRYRQAFPRAYQDDWVARSAVADILRIEELRQDGGPIMALYRPLEADPGTLRCKLFSLGGVALSDVLPTFEHMGTRVVDERPYEVQPSDTEPAWIYDFGLRCAAEDVERVRDSFEETFLAVRRGELEDDGLNGLVLQAGLAGREITVIRAMAKYLRQAGIAFSDAYMERTLVGHPDIARLLVRMFHARFDPDHRDEDMAERLARAMEMAIDSVQSLDEDRILRAFLSVVRATLRTNYFRRDEQGRPRSFLSLKLDPGQVPVLPLPRPRYEIFVYSPRVEGVHLRGGQVARGGLRWSDRREDFRTEILGLMKAQMVKNALIVPVGSKGGFVLKRPPAEASREQLQDEAIECYKTFLRGLLDVTDNIRDGEVVPPEGVVRYDEDDPYLVVAADKGTASFSDIANGVSAEYGFWLGDAFASGGSQGYDHKRMGITARGAWESVKRHFRELGTDIQTTDFTVVGIGDMSGDVFGNGMLLSPHIRLIAAFNHLHVFLDPDPDAEQSFAERRRVFELPRSSWDDYDEDKISEGGGVYRRSAKSIKLSPQVREALGIDAEALAPNDLIKAILRAPVDLLWNGGIGTYVKASGEAHGDAGDKANDGVRVDGGELRCRVVGEGGNLGFTQRARVEYARCGGVEQNGGRINTDAIDNVAGVNTSDHEVNIKILLDGLVRAGELTEKQRNELLHEMTDAVGAQVLYASYTQTQAISLALAQAAPMIDVHARVIRSLEQSVGLDRRLEFLPDDDVIAERKAAHQGLVAPELAVVMAYSKILLYARLLDSDLPEDPYLGHDLERYFPAPLPDRYREQMRGHRLRREIIATVVANQLVDRTGTTFAFRLGEETGCGPPVLARGYAVAREVFEMRPFWEAVEALDNQVRAADQLEMLIEARRLVERATRWLVRSNPDGIDIEAVTERFGDGARAMSGALPELLDGGEQERYAERAARFEQAGVPPELAARTARMPWLLSVFDVVEVSHATGRPLQQVMETYFRLDARLELCWLRERIIELPRANRWQALARAALRDDLYGLHRALVQQVLAAAGDGAAGDRAIDGWWERHREGVERALRMIDDVKASREYDATTLPVALREVRTLIR